MNPEKWAERGVTGTESSKSMADFNSRVGTCSLLVLRGCIKAVLYAHFGKNSLDSEPNKFL